MDNHKIILCSDYRVCCMCMCVCMCVCVCVCGTFGIRNSLLLHMAQLLAKAELYTKYFWSHFNRFLHMISLHSNRTISNHYVIMYVCQHGWIQKITPSKCYSGNWLIDDVHLHAYVMIFIPEPKMYVTLIYVQLKD